MNELPVFVSGEKGGWSEEVTFQSISHHFGIPHIDESNAPRPSVHYYVRVVVLLIGHWQDLQG